jgi:3-methyladenine DNA glycosylase/8-oxoguanine DNA glycosylase
MSNEAIKHLSLVDKKLSRLINQLGHCEVKSQQNQSPFESLAESIVYQQLTPKAAATILGRFKDLFPGKRFPSPKAILKLETEILRSSGLSRAKVAALQDLSEKTIAGVVPSSKVIEKLPDEEIMERLLTIRGVGPWTVEMMMIFKLGRGDVLPSTDFAIRKAFAKLYKMDELPTPKELSTYGERWRPYRSTAALYLWKSLSDPKK